MYYIWGVHQLHYIWGIHQLHYIWGFTNCIISWGSPIALYLGVHQLHYILGFTNCIISGGSPIALYLGVHQLHYIWFTNCIISGVHQLHYIWGWQPGRKSYDTIIVLSSLAIVEWPHIWSNDISQETPTDKLIDFEEYEGGCRGGQKVNKISGNAQ